MPKIEKPTDMTSVTIEDINDALTRVYAALQGRMDDDNLLEFNGNKVGLPSEKVLNYPVPTKPIYGDKFLINQSVIETSPSVFEINEKTGAYHIQKLIAVMEDNRNYTVLSANKSFNYYEGKAEPGSSNIKTTEPQIAHGQRRYSTSYIAPSQSDMYMSIPKSPEVKAITSEKVTSAGLVKRMMYTTYVRAVSNLDSTTTWSVYLSEPVETAEEIRFKVNIDSSMPVDAWADAGSHANFFIDVDVLCEVLV